MTAGGCFGFPAGALSVSDVTARNSRSERQEPAEEPMSVH